MHRQRRSLTWAEVWFAMFVIALISLFTYDDACAGDIDLSWTNPTEQESCTNAGPTTIDGVHIWQLVDTVDSPLEAYTISSMLPGTYTYAATAFNASGESRLSGQTEKTVDTWQTIGTNVRTVFRTTNSVILPIVGTIPLGTACDVNISITGPVFAPDGVSIINKTFYAVDSDLATFSGQEVPLVLAECG